MKKIISLLFAAFLLATTQTAYACSPAANVIYPTVSSVLLSNTAAIALLKPNTNGVEVSSELVIGNKNASLTMNLKLDTTSCGTRFNDFSADEYIVAVFEKGADVLNHFDLDNQFTFSFATQEAAIIKYTALTGQWEERGSVVVSQSGYAPTTYTLRPGMKDDFVRALQTALKVKLNLDDNFVVDGSYGPATSSAVKQFQASVGLTDDGLAGVLTQNQLVGVATESTSTEVSSNSNYAPTAYTLRPGMKDDFVRALQTALKVKLNLDNNFVVDGSYGPATSAAVKQFQASVGLTDDGLAGVITQARLSGVVVSEQANTVNATENQDTETAEDVEQTNNDVIDGEIKKTLIRAKNEVINFAAGIKDYTDAHSLVIRYNNEMLAISPLSDPLYKSSNGGQYFVYFSKLTNGSYVCVDDSIQKELIESDSKPNLETEQVSC